MFHLFGKHEKQTTMARHDDYNERNARIVCSWQQSVEASANCDYDALRATLLWARSLSADYRISLVGLWAHYHDRAIGYRYQ
jgi:hypothetical protein